MKKFCEKKYVLFDFDGVIADTEESNGNYLGLALKEFGVELTQKDRDRLIGSHDSHILLGLLERSPEKITMEQLLQKRKEIGNTYENGCIKPMEGLLEFIAGLIKTGEKAGSGFFDLYTADCSSIEPDENAGFVRCGGMRRHVPE